MATLTNSDWQCLNNFLTLIYEISNLEQLPENILAALPNVISGKLFEVVSFTGDQSYPPHFYTFPAFEAGIMAEMSELQCLHFLTHPVTNHYLSIFSEKALTISDFLKQDSIPDQKALSSTFLQSFGIADQIAIYFTLPASLKSLSKIDFFHLGKEHLGLIISRDSQNFTERDRSILNVLYPHLKQAYERLITFHQVHCQLAQWQSATDLVGLIAISMDGEVQWISQKAGEMLHRYLPPSPTPRTLPSVLQSWMHHHLAMMRQGDGTCALVKPLKFQRDRQKLSIRLRYCPTLGQVYLLLDEAKQESFSTESLQLLGLTKREAEVLFWVAKDKSLVEVGKLLSISDRTAKKHLEHIYEKFGVQTRLSAVIYALERLCIMG